MTKASESAYDFLRQRLFSGFYAPRAQLKEEHIADELGVSRTPVRVALRRLVDEGLVVAETNRGMFVAEWTDRDIQDVWALRLLLEPHGAMLAAERATPNHIEAMRDANARIRHALASQSPTRVADMQAANFDFHTAIIDAAGSPRLKAMAMQTVGSPMLIGTYYVIDDASIARSAAQHDDVLSAIEQHEPEIASKFMWLHLKVSISTYFAKRDAGREIESR